MRATHFESRFFPSSSNATGPRPPATAPLFRSDCSAPFHPALAKLRERYALGDARSPILVATIADPARDVFWAGSPRDMDLGAFCARRERVVRRTLVLVPSGERVSLEMAARFAQGEQVEVRALADTIEVRDGAVALGEASQAPAPKRAAAPPPEANAGHVSRRSSA